MCSQLSIIAMNVAINKKRFGKFSSCIKAMRTVAFNNKKALMAPYCAARIKCAVSMLKQFYTTSNDLLGTFLSWFIAIKVKATCAALFKFEPVKTSELGLRARSLSSFTLRNKI